MTIHITAGLNEVVNFCFVATTGLLVFPDALVVKDGLVVSPAPTLTITEFGTTGVYNVAYSSSATGKVSIHINGEIVAFIEVLTKSIYSSIRNIEDESTGSWIWDKVLGTLTMIRQDGSTLSTYAVVENTLTASREKT